MKLPTDYIGLFEESEKASSVKTKERKSNVSFGQDCTDGCNIPDSSGYIKGEHLNRPKDLDVQTTNISHILDLLFEIIPILFHIIIRRSV